MSANEENSTNPQAGRRVHYRILALLIVWVAFIFGTSCTVIRPEEFFGLISALTGAGRESMDRFAVFWGISWFTIVKGWHFTEFAILTVLAVHALKWLYRRVTSWSIFIAMLFSIGFAASDEFHQSFVPDRFGTVQDVLIDSLGVCTAGAIMMVRLKRIEATNESTQPSGSRSE